MFVILIIAAIMVYAVAMWFVLKDIQNVALRMLLRTGIIATAFTPAFHVNGSHVGVFPFWYDLFFSEWKYVKPYIVQDILIVAIVWAVMFTVGLYVSKQYVNHMVKFFLRVIFNVAIFAAGTYLCLYSAHFEKYDVIKGVSLGIAIGVALYMSKQKMIEGIGVNKIISYEQASNIVSPFAGMTKAPLIVPAVLIVLVGLSGGKISNYLQIGFFSGLLFSLLSTLIYLFSSWKLTNSVTQCAQEDRAKG